MDKHQSTTETAFVGRDGHVFPRESLMHVVAGVRHLLTWLICVCWRGVLTLIRMQGVPLVGYDMQPGQDWFTDTSAIKLPTVSWHDSGIPAASQ